MARNNWRGGAWMACCVAAGVLLAGCDGSQLNWGANPNASGGLFGTARGNPADPGVGKASGDGDWGIILAEYTGPGRQQNANKLKQYLVDSGWKDVYLIHDGDAQMSYVYHGPFRYDEVKTRLEAVHKWVDRSGIKAFEGAYPKALPQPDPPAPAEWWLPNSGGFWSLQVAHFVQPGPAFPATREMVVPKGWDRKRAAVEAVRALRAKGFPAFYYHTPKMSVVTVGAFPQSVFRSWSDERGLHYSKYDPNTETYLDPAVKALRDTVIDGEKVFLYNWENGLKVSQIVTRAEGKYKRPWLSFLVRVPAPREEDNFGME